MARESENREEIQGTKRLYRVWSQVDSKIELPPSLSGRSLLAKLDRVEQPVAPIGKIRFSPKVFSWQSGVAYAAAFALVLMLSSMLTQGERPMELLRGEIASAPAAVADTTTAEAKAMPSPAPETTETILPEPAAEPDMGVFAARSAGVEAAAAADEALGIGGQSEAILLGKDETYTYLWRVNDPADPDKEGFPVTASIVDTESGEVAAVIDLPDMLAVEGYYLYNDIIAFAGSGEDSAFLYALDISDKENPQSYFDLSQPGVFTGSSLDGAMLHLLTVTETAEGLDCEVVPLPGGESGRSCVITVVDLATRESSRKAFSGIEDVSLHGLYASIRYNGAVTAEHETGEYLAEIRLDGMDIQIADGAGQAEADPTEPTASATEPPEPIEVEPFPPSDAE